jgi:hypothetical protein
MWPFKKKCKHDYEEIGRYYEWHIVNWGNGYKLTAWLLLKCKLCGEKTTENKLNETLWSINTVQSEKEILKSFGYKDWDIEKLR